MHIPANRSQKPRAQAPLLAAMLAGLAVLAPGLSHAQQVNVLQRSFLNLGFELPALGGAGCRLFINEAAVPGWTTDHRLYAQGASATDGGTCSPLPTGYSAGTEAHIIELWRGPRTGGGTLVRARTGVQFAELNAEAASRISQNVCLENGDTVNWRLSHRGRESGTTPDVMRFLVGLDPIATMSTTNTGAGPAPTAQQGSVTVASGGNGWRDYSGSFVYSGVSGPTNLGFQAVSTGGSSVVLGNFLDDIQVNLRPFIELGSSTFNSAEGSSSGEPTLKIAGHLDAPLEVLVEVTGGTAVRGTDYTITSNPAGNQFVVTVPAGTYAGESIPLGLTAINNTLVQDGRTLNFRIVAQPSAYVTRSTVACGVDGVAGAAWTIADNDVDVRTTKTANPNLPDGRASFTVVFENNTAQPTVGPTNSHDVTVRMQDALPAGFSAYAWTCVAGGSPSAACPAASGIGAIDATAALRAGSGGAAGGRLTYTVSGTFTTGQCAAVTNTSTIALEGSSHQEATGIGSGFATPAPGGAGNNSSSASATPNCGTADVSIIKSVTPNPVRSGQNATWTLSVENAGPGAADGSIVQDDFPVSGLDCSAATVTCSASGNAECPTSSTIALLQTGLAIPTLPAGGSVQFQFACRVTASGTP